MWKSLPSDFMLVFQMRMICQTIRNRWQVAMLHPRASGTEEIHATFQCLAGGTIWCFRVSRYCDCVSKLKQVDKKKHPQIIELCLYTLPKFNIAPEKSWLEDCSPFGMVYFWGLRLTSGGYIRHKGFYPPTIWDYISNPLRKSLLNKKSLLLFVGLRGSLEVIRQINRGTCTHLQLASKD